MHYAIVNDTTGVIRQTGLCPPEQLQYKAKTGETAIECASHIADNTHKYADGVFVELPGPTDAEKHVECVHMTRGARTILLQDSDWTQASDSPLSDSKKAEWATYRQTLRDLPDSVAGLTSIDDVVFPTRPED